MTDSFDPWPLFRVLYVSPAYRNVLRSLGASIGAGWSGRNRALALAWGNERLGDSSRAEELFDGVRVAARDFLATGTREHTNLRHSALVHLGMALVGVDSVDAGLAILDQASDSLRQAPDQFSSQEVRKVLAEAYVAAGAWDDALRELRYLLDRPSALSTTLLEVDPVWDPIRDDPRFADLLRAFGEPGP